MVTDRLTNGDYFDPNVLSIPGSIIPVPPGVEPVLSPQTKDAVNHPSHYTAGNVEVIDYIEQVCALYPGDEAPHVANTIKYVSRAPLKGKKLEDLKKARWYLDRLITKLETK